jgi:hypothetical protein
MRAQEMTRLKQRKHLELVSYKRAFVLKFRYRCLSLIQARIRGILYRKRLAELTANQIIVAARYRGYRCRKMLHENSQRLRLGPEVHRVYKRGHLVKGAVEKYLLVEIYVCGHSYRFVGHDMEELVEYQGYVSGSELRERIQERVKKMGPLGYIPLWNKPKVSEYIISQLSIVTPIKALTHEMRTMDPEYALVMDPRLGPNTSGEGVQAKRIKSNILLDEFAANEYWQRKQPDVAVIVDKRYGAGKHQRRVAEMMESLKKYKMSMLKRELATAGVNFTAEFCTQELLQDVERQRYEVEKCVVHLRMMARWEKKATLEPIAELKKVRSRGGAFEWKSKERVREGVREGASGSMRSQKFALFLFLVLVLLLFLVLPMHFPMLSSSLTLFTCFQICADHKVDMDDDLLRADECDTYAREVLEKKVAKVWNDVNTKEDLSWGRSNPNIRHRTWKKIQPDGGPDG